MRSVHLFPLAMTALIAVAMIALSMFVFAPPVFAAGLSAGGSASGSVGATNFSGSAGVRSNSTTQTTARSTASTNSSRNSVMGGQALGTSVLDGNTNSLGRGSLDNTITGTVNGQPDGSIGTTRAAVGPANGTTDSNIAIGSGDASLGAGQAATIRGPRTADENSMLTNLNFGNSDSNHDNRLNASEFTAAGLSSTLFSSVDTNHDGFVSDAELRASGSVR